MTRGLIGLIGLIWLDVRVAWASRFIQVALALAVVFGIALRWVVPAELSPQAALLACATHPAQQARLTRLTSAPGVRALDGQCDGLDAALAASPDAVGLRLDDAHDALVLRGHEPAATRALLLAQARALIEGQGPAPAIKRLRQQSAPLALNRLMIPVMLGLDATLLGFMLIAVMVLQERAEGTTRAYRVTPGGAWRYIVSKLTLGLALVWLSGATMLAIAAPALLLAPALWIVLGLSGLTLTALGLAMAPWFRSLSTFLYPFALVGMALSLPMLPYMSPALAIEGVSWLPSAPVMFGARELLLGTTSLDVLAKTAPTLVISALALTIAAYASVQRRLMQEA